MKISSFFRLSNFLFIGFIAVSIFHLYWDGYNINLLNNLKRQGLSHEEAFNQVYFHCGELNMGGFLLLIAAIIARTMENRKKRKNQLKINSIVLICFLLVLGFCLSPLSAEQQPVQPQPSQQRQTSLLMPQKHFTRYDGLIKKYAKHYGFDWRLILAQIKQESAFKPEAKSWVGARGLMQLMPKTAAEMKVKNVLNPSENIAGGVCYLRKQYDIFRDVPEPHREMFALASYNCGAGRIFDSRDLAKFEAREDHLWDDIQTVMPKLTKEYKELHIKVWQKPQPRYGYFTGWKETIGYVTNIWKYYTEYQKQTI